MNNKHLSWYKEINNNFIIASRAYFLQSHGSRVHWLTSSIVPLLSHPSIALVAFGGIWERGIWAFSCYTPKRFMRVLERDFIQAYNHFSSLFWPKQFVIWASLEHFPLDLVTLGGWKLLGGRSAPVRNQLVICPPESLWRFGGRLKVYH